MRRLEGWIRGHARDLVTEWPTWARATSFELVLKLPARIFDGFFRLPEDGSTTRPPNGAQRLLGWAEPRIRAEQSGLELFMGAVMDVTQRPQC